MQGARNATTEAVEVVQQGNDNAVAAQVNLRSGGRSQYREPQTPSTAFFKQLLRA